MKKRIMRRGAFFIAMLFFFTTIPYRTANAENLEDEAVAEVVDIYETFGEDFQKYQKQKDTRANVSDYRRWAQSEPEWASIRLGSSKYDMNRSGCLITSISKLMVQCGLKKADDFNPGVLVKWLNKNGGFTSDGSMYWAQSAKYLKGFELKSHNYLSYGTYNTQKYTSKIIGWIKDGYHMVIAVKGAGHWVAVDEAKTLATGEIYIMDSLPDEKSNADLKLKDRYGSTFNRIAAFTGGTTPTGQEKEEELTANVTRIYGETRYETSYKIADELKKQKGVEKFHTIVIASGMNFADALAGSYLANIKEAPILMASDFNKETLKNYVMANLEAGGKIYLLGGTMAIPDEIISGLEGYEITRLWGETRYETNIEILKEAGITNEDILVCTGNNFADSLSASASKKPILLVSEELSEEQKTYLSELSVGRFYIIGGEAAVNDSVEEELKSFGEVSRIGGATRYDTSVLVANTFVEQPKAVVLAYAMNFPDGLCGGVLAESMNAPLILTTNGNESAAKNYVKGHGISKGAVLGGTKLISNKTVNNIMK